MFVVEQIPQVVFLRMGSLFQIGLTPLSLSGLNRKPRQWRRLGVQDSNAPLWRSSTYLRRSITLLPQLSPNLISCIVQALHPTYPTDYHPSEKSRLERYVEVTYVGCDRKFNSNGRLQRIHLETVLSSQVPIPPIRTKTDPSGTRSIPTSRTCSLSYLVTTTVMSGVSVSQQRMSSSALINILGESTPLPSYPFVTCSPYIPL